MDSSAHLATPRPGFWGRVLRALLSLRYRVRQEGLEDIPLAAEEGQGLLFLSSHPALVDPLILWSQVAGLRPRPLADAKVMSGLWGRVANRVVDGILIPDLSGLPRGREGRQAAAQLVEQGLRQVSESLNQGRAVFLYPAGRISRDGLDRLGGNSGVWRVLEGAPSARIILVRSRGLWGSSFSAAAGRRPGFTAAMFQAALTLLGNAIFFAPRREVRLEFREVARPAFNSKEELNACLEAYYNEGGVELRRVPRFFWQGRGGH